jgi:collagenase-like PrtC family protease
MKIIVGIDQMIFKQGVVEQFINEGVDEFFFGYIPNEWVQRYGWTICCNRRPFGPRCNFWDLEEVKQFIGLCHKKGKKVFFTLNEHEYTCEQTDLLKTLVEQMEELAVDGYIIANFAIMLVLREWKIKSPIHLSTSTSCINPPALVFYKNNIEGITRCILPRHLTMGEIQQLAMTARRECIRLEVFAALPCFFDEGHCFTIHSNSFREGDRRETGIWCRSSIFKRFTEIPSLPFKNWKNNFKKTEGELTDPVQGRQSKTGINLNRDNLIPQETEEVYFKAVKASLKILGNLELIEKNLEKGLPPLEGVQCNENVDNTLLKYITNGSCSFCAIPKFKEIGIDSIKVPIRGKRSRLTIYFIKIVKKLTGLAGITPGTIQALLGNPDFCSGKNCYYNFPMENKEVSYD